MSICGFKNIPTVYTPHNIESKQTENDSQMNSMNGNISFWRSIVFTVYIINV